MKKGKSVKLNLYSPIKSVYGTVDSKNLKSLYINIQSWVSPKFEHDNWNRVVGNLNREIKHSVFNSIDSNLFKETSIVDLDLRTSGISHGKKSFFNLEVNLYTNEEMDFKSSELKESIKKIIKNIVRDNVIENKYFDFSLSKIK
jgi:polyribonucleotide nucleotidyltransferase